MDVQASSTLLSAQYSALSFSGTSADGANISGTFESLSVSIDTVSFGQGQLTGGESLQVVLERALSQLQQVVGDAYAELGLDPSEPLDLSPEATADRIAGFALNFFDQFQANNPDLEGDEAPQAFVDLISGAVQQGVDEARGILESLSALDPDTDSKIDSILELVLLRFDEFLQGGGESEPQNEAILDVA